MKKHFKRVKKIPVVLLLFTSILANAQTTYFDEGRYKDYPIITFRENLLGNPVYKIEGKKIKASEVRRYMEIMPGDANEFIQNQRKIMTGVGLKNASRLLFIGSTYFMFNNNITPESLRNYFLISTIGTAINRVGADMKTNGIRKANFLIDNHNYLIRKEQIEGMYLRSDFRRNFFGQKMDIYEGPNLLSKHRLKLIKEDYPELKLALNKAERIQTTSSILSGIRVASDFVILAYIISPRLQSSTPSDLLVPLVATSLSINLTTPLLERSARNKTRIGLQNFNFR